MGDTKEIMVRVPVDLYGAVKDRADADDRSMAAVLRHYLATTTAFGSKQVPNG